MQFLGATVQGVPIQNELATPIDCKGKYFYCVDSTHFLHCSDVHKNGQTETKVGGTLISCGGLFCDNTQEYECSSPVDPGSTTTQPPITVAPSTAGPTSAPITEASSTVSPT